MKADRRHELRENELSHALQVAKNFATENSKQLGLVVLVAVVIVTVVSVTVRTRAANREDAWKRKSTLTFASLDEGKQGITTLEAIVRESDDPKLVFSSLLDQGLHALELAHQVPLPPDDEMNNKAQSAFETLLSRFPNNPLAIGTANLGLATTEENAFVLDGSPEHKERAKAHLETVLNTPSLQALPFFRLATDRLEKLDTTFTRVEFVAAPVPVETKEDKAPATITPIPIPAEEVPEAIRKQAGEVLDKTDPGAP